MRGLGGLILAKKNLYPYPPVFGICIRPSLPQKFLDPLTTCDWRRPARATPLTVCMYGGGNSSNDPNGHRHSQLRMRVTAVSHQFLTLVLGAVITGVIGYKDVFIFNKLELSHYYDQMRPLTLSRLTLFFDFPLSDWKYTYPCCESLPGHNRSWNSFFADFLAPFKSSEREDSWGHKEPFIKPFLVEAIS